MSGLLFWDRQGRPLTLLDWAEKHADLAYHFVAMHWVRGWQVSTIWLGINGSLNPFTKVPLIFETMIFAPGDVTIGDDLDLDGDQWRYPTEAAAQAGHDRALAAVVEKLGPESAADIVGPLVAGSSDENTDWDIADLIARPGASPGIDGEVQP